MPSEIDSIQESPHNAAHGAMRKFEDLIFEARFRNDGRRQTEQAGERQDVTPNCQRLDLSACDSVSGKALGIRSLTNVESLLPQCEIVGGDGRPLPNARKLAADCKGSICGTPRDMLDRSRQDIFSPGTPAEQKLAAVRDLARSGITMLHVEDSSGRRQSYRLEIEQAGANREMVHMHVIGDSGREQTVLRGIANVERGRIGFERERDPSGQFVDFYGRGLTQHQALKRDGGLRIDMELQADPAKLDAASTTVLRSPFHQVGDPRDRRVPRDERSNMRDRFAPRDGRGLPSDRLVSREERLVSREERLVPREERLVPREERLVSREERLVPRDNSARGAISDTIDRAAAQAGHASTRMIRTDEGVYLRAGFAVDADGSPRARRIDPHGSPNTSMRYTDGRSVNAETVPYIVLPKGKYQQHGIRIGDMALVRNRETGRVAVAVFADVGPAHKSGEGSMYLAQQLGLNPNPRYGGTQNKNIEYFVLPGSGGSRPRNEQELKARIRQVEERYGLRRNGEGIHEDGERPSRRSRRDRIGEEGERPLRRSRRDRIGEEGERLLGRRHERARGDAPDSENALQSAALNAARMMNSVGRCFRGVKNALERIGVSLHGGSAYMAADQLARHPRFEEIPAHHAGPGTVAVHGRSGAHRHGHIAVLLENGMEASDHIQRRVTGRGYGGTRYFRLTT